MSVISLDYKIHALYSSPAAIIKWLFFLILCNNNALFTDLTSFTNVTAKRLNVTINFSTINWLFLFLGVKNLVSQTLLPFKIILFIFKAKANKNNTILHRVTLKSKLFSLKTNLNIAGIITKTGLVTTKEIMIELTSPPKLISFMHNYINYQSNNDTKYL